VSSDKRSRRQRAVLISGRKVRVTRRAGYREASVHLFTRRGAEADARPDR